MKNKLKNAKELAIFMVLSLPVAAVLLFALIGIEAVFFNGCAA